MRKSAVDHREGLVDGLISSRQEILTIIRQLPVERLDEACIGVWCIKDLVAHLIGWDETNLQATREILAGQRPAFFAKYDKDWQTYNAELVARYSKEPFEALLADLERSQRELVSYLRALPARDVLDGKTAPGTGRTITIRGMLRAEASDERIHAQQLQEYFQPLFSAQRRIENG